MQWAVKLEGHEFDLDDWKTSLRPPFDPTVEIADLPDSTDGTTKAYLLKARAFGPCTTKAEVRELAIPLMRSLNALAAIHNGTRPLRFNTIVEVLPDGTFRRHLLMQARGGSIRVHGRAAFTIGGTPLPPQESFVQRAHVAAVGNVRAALEHFERADNWHDLYKAFEAIEDHVGGRDNLRALGVTRRDITDFAMSAQLARHHRPNGVPSRVFTLSEGRGFVSKLIRTCLP